MICPKCESVEPDNSKICSSCGYKFSENSVRNKSLREKNSSKKKFFKIRKNNRVKIYFIIIAVIIAAVTIIAISVGVSSNKGIRKCEKLAKKIGQSSEKAANYANVEFTKASDYSFLNGLTDYSYICESDKKTDIYGVSIPLWAIFCTEDMFGNLSDIAYYNFTVLENNINGEKKKSRFDISSIKTGMNKKDVSKLLDMDLYCLSVSDGIKSEKYKYYYKDKKNDDIKAYYLTIIFDDDNKVSSPVIEEENVFINDIIKASNE